MPGELPRAFPSPCAMRSGPGKSVLNSLCPARPVHAKNMGVGCHSFPGPGTLVSTPGGRYAHYFPISELGVSWELKKCYLSPGPNGEPWAQGLFNTKVPHVSEFQYLLRAKKFLLRVAWHFTIGFFQRSYVRSAKQRPPSMSDF